MYVLPVCWRSNGRPLVVEFLHFNSLDFGKTTPIAAQDFYGAVTLAAPAGAQAGFSWSCLILRNVSTRKHSTFHLPLDAIECWMLLDVRSGHLCLAHRLSHQARVQAEANPKAAANPVRAHVKFGRSSALLFCSLSYPMSAKAHKVLFSSGLCHEMFASWIPRSNDIWLRCRRRCSQSLRRTLGSKRSLNGRLVLSLL